MNTYDGEIKKFESVEEMLKAQNPPTQAWKEFDRNLLTEMQRRQLDAEGRTHLSRNSVCPCGSGKRFKNCCYTGPAARL